MNEMEFYLGYIVTTGNSPVHKRIIGLGSSTSELEWWSDLGYQRETVSTRNLVFVSTEPTKQFLEMKQLSTEASKRFSTLKKG